MQATEKAKDFEARLLSLQVDYGELQMQLSASQEKFVASVVKETALKENLERLEGENMEQF